MELTLREINIIDVLEKIGHTKYISQTEFDKGISYLLNLSEKHGKALSVIFNAVDIYNTFAHYLVENWTEIVDWNKTFKEFNKELDDIYNYFKEFVKNES